jgi:hypothetical protein
MKPERAAKNFFGQVMRPIVASNMQQFVTGNCGLEWGFHGREPFGQQNYRRGETESDRRVYIGGKAKLGAGIHAGAHLFENGNRFGEQRNWRRCPAELAKSQKSHREDCESGGDSGENYDADNLGEDLKAGKMPMREGGAGCWDYGDGCDVRRDQKHTDVWQAMPGLDDWEQQADGKERAPIDEKYAGLADLEKTR